jgi:hypothetical protein
MTRRSALGSICRYSNDNVLASYKHR